MASSICREKFLDEAVNKIPKKIHYVMIEPENFDYLRSVIQSIITGTLKDHERLPCKIFFFIPSKNYFLQRDSFRF